MKNLTNTQSLAQGVPVHVNPVLMKDTMGDAKLDMHILVGPDEVELQKTGKIENSFHISRGLLEFSIHPESAYVQNKNLDLNKEIVLFCAAGGRSALAAKTLEEMGFKNVSHIDGGFGSMKNSGFKIIK